MAYASLVTVDPDCCESCGASEARASLGGTPLCDRCFDRRIASITGFPELPDAPPDLSLRDSHGESRPMRFRVWRAPSGIVVDLEEVGRPLGEGFRFSVVGGHHGDVAELIAQVSKSARQEMRRRYLTPNPNREGWLLAGDEIRGWLTWSDKAVNGVGTPYDAVIEGRAMSWDDLGRALEAFEGFRFRLTLEGRNDVAG